MTKEDRVKLHAEALEEISRLTLADSFTDQVDQVGTLTERARMIDFEVSSHTATEKACDAFDRLLKLAETRDSGQIRRIARFLAASWGSQLFELQDLRSLDQEIGDDMLAVMDGIRYGRVAVFDMAKDAGERVPAVLKLWDLA